MEVDFFETLAATLREKGDAAAADQLIAELEQRKDYPALFYALLVKKRLELGVSPVPTEAALALPESVHAQYEEGIRLAARRIGELFLQDRNLAQAWPYFRMIGESAPVISALDNYQLGAEEDAQPLVDLAFHQGLNPRKGFDWILDRFGICSAITLASGQDFADTAIRSYCIQKLVRALYDQLSERIAEDVAAREGQRPVGCSLGELMADRDWLFETDFAHVDVSHLQSVVQMSLALPACDELHKARDLSNYGQRLAAHLRYAGEPPFENFHEAHRYYLDALLGERVDEAIAYFRDKLEAYEPDQIGSLPAEVLINLLVRVGRPGEAAQIARRYLRPSEGMRGASPSLAELCRQAGNYDAMIEASREQNDPVHFLAGMLAQQPAQKV
ncbi:MAG TPA: hypothetical protein VGP68_08035 [Gemmataceae bacterium]|jgi:hypothetical protein|nr:hypothetical protein [Gemmataceae bacterium]